MNVRLCPLCDQEMKKRHYCHSCRSFIWKANLVDIHFNSESQGMGEVDCTKIPVKNFPAHTVNRQRNSSIIGMVIIAAFIILALMTKSGVGEIFSVKPSKTAVVEDNGTVHTQLTEHDIQKFNTPCNGKPHMAIDGSVVVNAAKSYLLANGYDLTGRVKHSFYGYTEQSEFENITLYENITVFSLDDDYTQSIEISADAVTGELHSLNIYLKTEAENAAFLSALFTEAFGIQDLTREDYLDFFTFEIDSYKYSYVRNYAINVGWNEYSDCFSTYISHNDHPYNYEDVPEEWHMLSDEAIGSLGECNFYSHMDIYGAKCIAVVDTLISDKGDTTQFSEAKQNQERTIPQSGSYTYTETAFIHRYQWNLESGAVIIIDADTNTDAVHEIHISGLAEDETGLYLKLICKLIGISHYEQLTELCLEQYEEDGYSFINYNDLEIYFTKDRNDSYSMSVISLFK